MTDHLAKMLIIFGVVLVIAGIAILFREKMSWVKMIGNLPGDIHIKREGFQFYFPLTTGLLISALLTLILRFWR